MAALLFPRKVGESAANVNRAGIPAAFPTFWKGFLTGTEEPWVIFSNARFAGRPDVGMRYYVPSRDAGEPILDHYTGVGEVLAVHELDRVFALLHQEIRVKRGSLFSLDDAKNNDLIFIGSPSENLTLLDIPSTQEFTFRQIPTGTRRGNTEIVNVHPRAGEPKEYMASPNTEPLTEDYAVVALVRGINEGRSELILAGTTTLGTQAAVEYVSRQQSLEELLLRLSVSKSGDLKPFEAVLRVKIVRGVPVNRIGRPAKNRVTAVNSASEWHVDPPSVRNYGLPTVWGFILRRGYSFRHRLQLRGFLQFFFRFLRCPFFCSASPSW